MFRTHHNRIVIIASLDLIFVMLLSFFSSRMGGAYNPTFLAVQIIAALVIFYFAAKDSPPLNHSKKHIESLLMVLGAWFVSILVFGGLSSVFELLHPVSHGKATEIIGNYTQEKHALGGRFESIIFAPITEEIICRLGLFWGLIKTRRVSKPAALILSSGFFAVAHVSAHPMMMLSIFAIGVLSGTIFLQFGLLWSILFHIVVNLMPVLNYEGFLDNFLVFGPFMAVSFAGSILFIVNTGKFVRQNRTFRTNIRS